MLPVSAVMDVDWRAVGLLVTLAAFVAAGFCYIGLASTLRCAQTSCRR